MRFLQKINIYLYLFILMIFSILFFTIPVNASVDTNSTFNVTIPDYDSNFENYTCGSENVKDFLHNFLDSTDFDSTYYDLFIDNNFDSQIVFYLIPKNNDNINNYLQYRGQLNSYSLSYNFRYWNDNYSNARWYYLFYKSCTSDISSSNSWNSFLTALNTGTIGSTSSDNVGQLSSNSSNQIPYFGGTQTLSSIIYNGSSYDTSLWYYFSSRKLQYNATNSTLNNNTLSFKKLYLVDNDTTYNIGDEIPSYYDLYGVSPTPIEPTFKNYQGSIDTLYTNLNVSDFTNYSLKVNFDIDNFDDPLLFIDNINFDYVCSGRVDNTNYYSYESFPCSLTSIYSINGNTIEYTFNNIVTSQSLINYDKFYVTIKSNYLDPSISTIINSFNFSYNYGDFINFKYDGPIFETFHNLPLNFKLYLSSNNINSSESVVDVFDYNLFDYGLKVYYTDNRTFDIKGDISHFRDCVNFEECTYLNYYGYIVSNLFNYGLLVTQQNSVIPFPTLKMIFSSGQILSFNNTSNTDFYIIDSQGVISNNNVNIPIINNSSNNYDISYYINVVNTFINDLSSDSLELASITQNFYDNIPPFFQTFIFVLFIISCVYFTYLLIRKW